MLALVKAINAIASKIDGIDIRPSMMRITMGSNHLTNPVTKPMAMPITVLKIATATPTVRETRAPYMTRLYTSRPNASVPNQLSQLGGFKRLRGVTACGSTVAKYGAKTAINAMNNKVAAPITAKG